MTSYPTAGDRPGGNSEGVHDPGRFAPTTDAIPDHELVAGVEIPDDHAYGGAAGIPSTPTSTTVSSGGQDLRGAAASETSESGSKQDVAKAEVTELRDNALDAGSNVVDTAKREAGNVVQEARRQAGGVLDQLRSDVREQGSAQKDKVASTLRSLSEELGSMASTSRQDGPVTDLARQASRRGGEIAHWLDTHEAGDALEEVKRYGRRHPFAFLAICAAAGVVVGRLSRGAVAANTSLDSPKSSSDGPGSSSVAHEVAATGGYGSDPVAAPRPYPGSVGAEGAPTGPDVMTAPGWTANPAAGTVTQEPLGPSPRSTGVLNGPGDSYDDLPTGAEGGEYRP